MVSALVLGRSGAADLREAPGAIPSSPNVTPTSVQCAPALPRRCEKSATGIRLFTVRRRMPVVGERLFRFLFKYPPLVFQQGDFTWGVSRPCSSSSCSRRARSRRALLTYRRVSTLERRRDRAILVALRVALLALLRLLPAPPDADPQGGGAAAEFPRRAARRFAQHDDRRSRRPAAQRRSCSSSSPARTARCSTRCRSASCSASSASPRRPTASTPPADLKFDGTATRLGPALDRARDELVGPAARRPRDGDRRRRHLRRRARRVAGEPEGALDSGVHGRRRPGALRARHPGHARRNAARRAEGHRRSSSTSCSRRPAIGGQTVPLNVEDDGRIVEHAGGDAAARRRVGHGARCASPRTKPGRAHVPVPACPSQAGEQVTQNNARDALVEVARPPREGPLLRRRAAVRDEVHPPRRRRTTRTSQVVDPAAHGREQVPTGVDVDNADELVGGFPKTREELFAYRAIILGSVEAASFTPEQLRMLADFVSKRGGGLLMLGGRRSFAEGGWGGTPVAEVLPVVLDATADAATTYFSRRSRRSRRAPARVYPGHPDRRRREGVDREVGRHAAGHERQPDSRGEAGRDGAADRHRQPQAGADRPRVSALRPRQGARDADSGLLALADGSRRCRSPTRRTRCSGGGWCAGWSTACRTGQRDDDRTIASSRASRSS